jgi:hypothetical protein
MIKRNYLLHNDNVILIIPTLFNCGVAISVILIGKRYGHHIVNLYGLCNTNNIITVSSSNTNRS